MALMRLFSVLVFSGTLIVPQEAAKSLDGRIKAGIAGFKGHVSIYAKNLATGTTYSLAGDDPVREAVNKIAGPSESSDAAYVLYTPGKQLIELRRLEYDIWTAQDKIVAAGLPQRLADRLALGK